MASRPPGAFPWMHILRLALVSVAVAYAALFIIENGGRVRVVLPFVVQGELFSWLLVLLVLAIGAGAAALAMSWPLVRLRSRARRDARRIAELERELHGLRTLPIEESISVDSKSDELPPATGPAAE